MGISGFLDGRWSVVETRPGNSTQDNAAAVRIVFIREKLEALPW
jgi:hypothetical protein